MRGLVLMIAACVILCPLTSAQSPSLLARQTVQTISELRKIGLPSSGWDNDGDVLRMGPPARVPGLLRRLNSELRGMILQALNDPNRHQIVDRDTILGQLRTAGWREIADHRWNAYGEIIDIRFDWQVGRAYHPGLVVVSTQLWIPCGGQDPDAAIYVIEGSGHDWKLDIAVDADFGLGSGEFAEGLMYEISPPDEKGGWYLAVAHSPPDCHAYSYDIQYDLKYEIYRPSSDPDKPIVVLSGREPIITGYTPPFWLQTESDWFSVVSGQLRSLDGEPGIVLSRFQVEGNRAMRIQPLAFTPEDFLDEWLRLDWDNAARWTPIPIPPGLHQWHTKLRSLTWESAEIDSIRSCDPQKGAEETRQLELQIDPAMNPNVAERTVFVLLNKRDGDFRVAAIGTSANGSCSGPPRKPSIPPLTLPEWW